MEKEVKTTTVSLWSHVLSNSTEFENPLYTPSTFYHVLYPLTSSRHIKLWDKYYCRWNPAFRHQVFTRVLIMNLSLLHICNFNTLEFSGYTGVPQKLNPRRFLGLYLYPKN